MNPWVEANDKACSPLNKNGPMMTDNYCINIDKNKQIF